MSTKTSIFCQIMPEKNQVKNFDPSKNEKNVQICASSHICILCFQGCIDCKESTKNFKRHISSNGPHLVSPQKAKKFSKTQNEVTVKPYIISFFYRHPVYIKRVINRDCEANEIHEGLRLQGRKVLSLSSSSSQQAFKVRETWYYLGTFQMTPWKDTEPAITRVCVVKMDKNGQH